MRSAPNAAKPGLGPKDDARSGARSAPSAADAPRAAVAADHVAHVRADLPVDVSPPRDLARLRSKR